MIRKSDKTVIYVFVILNSICGLQIAGVSVNSVLVGLFFIYSISAFLRYNRNTRIVVRKNSYFTYYTLFTILSSLFSCFYTFVLPHVSIVITYMINGIVYLGIYMLLSNTKSEYIDELVKTFKWALIIAARVQAIWGMLQIILLYGFRININQILFVDILHSTTGRDWIMGFFTGNYWNMRITGLNFENSNFAMIICIGVALENNRIWKLILIGVAVLSLSRTGWLIILGLIIIEVVRRLKTKGRTITKKRLLTNALIFVGAIITVCVVYKSSYSLQRQINNILFRATDQDSLNISGSRHLFYYPYGIYLWLFDANILQKILGYGMRCSGIPFTQNAYVTRIIGITEHFNSAWAVECDPIGILLGGGIFALIFYYLSINKCIKDKSNILRDAIIVLLIGGLTYHYHSISYFLILLLIASLYSDKNKLLHGALNEYNRTSKNPSGTQRKLGE